MSKLPHSFYTREDVVQISKELLGKYLFTLFDFELTGGKIVETEAYEGITDKASHAFGNRFTNRTKVMYERGGISYVYLCYGIHSLFNVITNSKDIPHAILIRAIEPVEGVDIMLRRRKLPILSPILSAGPGSLSEALGIKVKHTGLDLTQNQIWIEDRGVAVSENMIISSPRVGVAYASEDALRPYRFRIKENKWTSKAK